MATTMPDRTSHSTHAVLAALAAALILTVTVGGAASAGETSDHERAREALEAGEILPLRTILERIERDYPGRVMEVELERSREGWIYEIKLLRKGGALVKLEVDARDGAVLGVKSKGDRPPSRDEIR